MGSRVDSEANIYTRNGSFETKPCALRPKVLSGSISPKKISRYAKTHKVPPVTSFQPAPKDNTLKQTVKVIDNRRFFTVLQPK